MKTRRRWVRTMVTDSFRRSIIHASAVLCLSIGIARADVAGTWNTTGLTRTVVTSLISPGTPPEKSVSIGDGSYSFDPDRIFSAAAISGRWTQIGSAYSVRPSRHALETAYANAMIENDQTIEIRLVRRIRG